MRWILILLFFLALQGCRRPDSDFETKFGKLCIIFHHYWSDEPIQYDTLKYVNAAGNLLMINELQYFISDVTLHSQFGSRMIKDWTDIYYVDKDIPSTLTWQVYDKIPVGIYNTLSFIFGIPGHKNKPGMFSNPPERDMFWPYILGGDSGGYHYMKMNGKYLNQQGLTMPFDFHLGVGQIYASNVIDVDSIIGYVQNYFPVQFSDVSIPIEEGKVTVIELIFDVKEWFESPYVFDFNVYGSYIMQNQQAMWIACQNGKNAFSIKRIYIK